MKICNEKMQSTLANYNALTIWRTLFFYLIFLNCFIKGHHLTRKIYQLIMRQMILVCNVDSVTVTLCRIKNCVIWGQFHESVFRQWSVWPKFVGSPIWRHISCIKTLCLANTWLDTNNNGGGVCRMSNLHSF